MRSWEEEFKYVKRCWGGYEPQCSTPVWLLAVSVYGADSFGYTVSYVLNDGGIHVASSSLLFCLLLSLQGRKSTAPWLLPPVSYATVGCKLNFRVIISSKWLLILSTDQQLQAWAGEPDFQGCNPAPPPVAVDLGKQLTLTVPQFPHLWKWRYEWYLPQAIVLRINWVELQSAETVLTR